MRAIVHCPNTGDDFEVELPADAVIVAQLWRRTVAAHCPHCRKTHLEGFKQLFMRSVIDSNVDGTSLAHMAFRRYE